MPPKKSTAEMTEAEFERYLKRNGLTGLAAVKAAANRRAVIAAKKTAAAN